MSNDYQVPRRGPGAVPSPASLAPDPDRCRWGLYVIVDPAVAGRPAEAVAEAALAGGATVLQLRDKTAPFEDLLTTGTALRCMTRDAGAALIVNDNPYLAREIGADGVHVGQHDFPLYLVREIVGPHAIIGLSTHTKQQALDARRQGADYIGVGPIYPTATKIDAAEVVGTALLEWVSDMVALPNVAIGGVTAERIPEVMAAGATNVAMIREVVSAPDIAARTRELRAAIDRASAQRRRTRP